MSWKAEVKVKGNGKKWYTSALRYKTKEEAEASVSSLQSRWPTVLEVRVIEVNQPPNYRWYKGQGQSLN